MNELKSSNLKVTTLLPLGFRKDKIGKPTVNGSSTFWIFLGRPRIEQGWACKSAEMTLERSGNFIGLATHHLRSATARRLYLFILHFRNLQVGFHVTNRDILQKRTRSPIAVVRQAVCNAVRMRSVDLANHRPAPRPFVC